MFGHFTYVIFELGWSVPVIALQWAVGFKTLWRRRRTLVVALVVATAYLTCTDAVAIACGIWTLHRGRILGVYLGNVPLEEAIFFFITNAMVTQSVLLVYRPPGHTDRLSVPFMKR